MIKPLKSLLQEAKNTDTIYNVGLMNNVLPQEELEEAAQNIQEQLWNRVIKKFQAANASTA